MGLCERDVGPPRFRRCAPTTGGNGIVKSRTKPRKFVNIFFIFLGHLFDLSREFSSPTRLFGGQPFIGQESSRDEFLICMSIHSAECRENVSVRRKRFFVMACHREFAIKEESMSGNPCSQIYEERVELSSSIPKL